MVFWGVEVKPGEHFTPSGDEDGEYEGCRLHLSQATLGLDAKGKERTVVKCKVGDCPELLLCSLTPGVSESCSLDLLFDQDVVFSVAGSTSVHLVGYYMPLDDDEEEDNDYEFDGSEFDSEEDMDDEDYDEDSDMDDIGALHAPPSSVTITELDDDVTPGKIPVKNKQILKTDEMDKKATKKRKRALSSKEKKQSSNEVGNVAAEEVSEDEDGFPQPSEKTEVVNGSEKSVTPSTSSDEPKKQKKKKKKKKKNEKVPTQVEELEKTPKIEEVEKTPNTAAKESGFEVRSSTKTSTANEIAVTPRTDATGKKVKKSGPSVRKFPNGLETEEISMGRPDARQTKPGKRVTVHYTGRLKSNGKIFDSSIGRKPFVFRLGVGEVVKGWDVGVTGMRIGDKRRITIPPAMGYGAKGSGSIPGNSWLVFDVEVVDVAK